MRLISLAPVWGRVAFATLIAVCCISVLAAPGGATASEENAQKQPQNLPVSEIVITGLVLSFAYGLAKKFRGE